MEENKNIEEEQPAENVPVETIPVDKTTMPEAEEQQTPNTEPQTKEMETHAQHLHKAPGTKFWHYFYEFLMLFLAVFCGFLAEYALEHKIEADREKEYMQSLCEDLRRDTASVTRVYNLVLQQKFILDSLIELVYYQPLTGANISRLYSEHYSSGRALTINFEDRTMMQLKNAGGMRLIKHRAAADSILNYWGKLEIISFIRERLEKAGNDIGDLAVRIFYSKYVVSGDGILVPPKAILPNAVFIDDDPKLMAEYVNRQNTKRNRINLYLFTLLDCKESAARLIKTIRKAYHIE